MESLFKRPNHVRGLAQELKTNQTTVARKLKELRQENILDYRTEGKNNVFFIKKTLEAKQYACLTELYKLSFYLRKYPRLRNMVEKIRKNNKIHLAIIFGSYAKGIPTKNSDMDLYVETKDRKIKADIANIDSKLSVKIGLYDQDSLLIQEIEKNHLIIKGVEEYYEKSRLFA